MPDVYTEREGAQWVEAKLLGSGWAAVMLVHVEALDCEGESLGNYVDVQATGYGRYATREEALTEGRAWAETEGLPFVG
jgi:hypothetical protein